MYLGITLSDEDVSNLFVNNIANRRNGGLGIEQVREDATEFVNGLSHFRSASEGEKNEYIETLVRDFLQRN